MKIRSMTIFRLLQCGEFPVQGGYLTLLRSGCANILRIIIGMRRLSVGDSDGSVEIR